MISETVGAISGPSRTYRRVDPVVVQQGQSFAHGLVHSQAAADPRFCGVIAWCGFDYPSAQGFQGVKYPGIIDEFRVPKLGAAIYISQVNPNQRVVIEPAFYWDFSGNCSVRTLNNGALIWANADKLELFLSGKPFASLEPDSNMFPHLKYPPFIANFTAIDNTTKPELRIDAYASGQLLGSRNFSSDTSTDKLSMVSDDEFIMADGSDVTRVVFRVVDTYGAPRPLVDGSVQLQLTGPATLIGDNPFPLGDTGGVGAVWIRSKRYVPGDALLVAKHPSLGSVQVKITIV